MKRSRRAILLGIGLVGVAVLYLAACSSLPAAAKRSDRYAAWANRLAFCERQVTGVVFAVNFDFRAFDTLGEEFILFASIMGVVVLLRETEDKPERAEDAETPRRAAPQSEAVRLWTLGATGPTVLFGLYLVAHGQITPGGAFQGGVVLASAPLLIYLADGLEAFRSVVPHRLVEMMEAIGAAGYLAIGWAGWFAGREFLANIFPLGTRGEVNSGGAILAINYAVALAVAAGFVTLLHAFLQSSLNAPRGKK